MPLFTAVFDVLGNCVRNLTSRFHHTDDKK